jgi:hypothetical protein
MIKKDKVNDEKIKKDKAKKKLPEEPIMSRMKSRKVKVHLKVHMNILWPKAFKLLSLLLIMEEFHLLLFFFVYVMWWCCFISLTPSGDVKAISCRHGSCRQEKWLLK